MAGLIKQLHEVHKSLPLSIRQVSGWIRRKFVPHYIVGTKEFEEYFQFLQKSQWWSLEELRAYQLEKMKEVVLNAYEQTPFYRRLYDEHHFHPSEIHSLDDVHKIPIITKEDVRNNIDDLIPTQFDKSKLRLWVTGGSTGTPLGIYQDKFTCDLYEGAFRWRQWSWAGYKFFDRKAQLKREGIHVIGKDGKEKCWDYNPHENEVVLNSREMTEENLLQFVEVIQEFKPQFLVGFPSALEIFARFVTRNHVQLPPIKACFCETEKLYDSQRLMIETAFNTKVFSGYGMSERTADAVECEQHNGYHVSMEYGLFELVDQNMEPVTQPGGEGNVIGTGFFNHTMPLIRYLMNDIAVLATEPCPCKRQGILIKEFKGRLREYFVARSGRLLPLQLVWSGRHPVWSKIREINFYQDKAGEVITRVVKAPQFSEEEVSRELKQEIGKILKEGEFKVTITYHETLHLTHRGKLGFLEQKLPISFEDLSKSAE